MSHPNPKRKILIIGFGTFCDNNLLDCATKRLRPDYTTIFLTDSSDKTAAERYDIVYNYDTPKWLLQDVRLKVANSTVSLLRTGLQNPLRVHSLWKWARQAKFIIRKIIAQHDISAILVWYPATILFVAGMTLKMMMHIPVGILYYGPGYYNRYIPWQFDNSYRDSNYDPYDITKENQQIVHKSWNVQLGRFSYIIASNMRVSDLFSKAHVLCLWDEHQLPKHIQPVFGTVKHLGLCHPDVSKAKWTPSPDLAWLTTTSQIIFISFGSYGKSAVLQPVLDSLIPTIHSYCAENNVRALFHNGGKKYETDRVSIINGFIPYEYIVPKSRLIVFTGSVCLQGVALFHGKPMLFVPLLAEQFFWAKNYEFYTDVPYVDHQNLGRIDLSRAVTSKLAISYVSKVKRHTRSSPSGGETLKQFVDSTIVGLVDRVRMMSPKLRRKSGNTSPRISTFVKKK